ncbi:cobyrinate a,c-diamide synthase [Faunimonas sp. B44]|uniref:cobyrinate a,c-diamide synthase n=1 Tax=Faunimonas sp. B44 TaxID=3461493 RepID=UPI004043E8DE
MSAPARGLVVAAASSHSGKTVLTIGLVAALRRQGLRVAAAKGGPDYIDPRFLEAASGRAAFNLDPWAMAPERVAALAADAAADADLLVVEGVMGLYDGGEGGAGSTAALARLLGLPVVLVVGADGLAQSAAAIAEGFSRLAEGFPVAGAIVNRVASERHAALIREGFARSSVPLLGLVRRDAALALKSRHLGLVQAGEHAALSALVGRAADAVAEGCDLEAIAAAAAALPAAGAAAPGLAPPGQRIAVAADLAFAFAYPHLLASWRAAGAEILPFSPLADEPPAAECDAIFLPGGYPELHAGRLAAAGQFRAGMRAAAAQGALVYGECGGYMALGEALVDAEGATHAMLGLLPLVTSFSARRLHLGYRRAEAPGGLPWRGPLSAHEFHYASVVSEGAADALFQVTGADGGAPAPAGLRRGRVMGSFVHVIDAMAGEG